MWYWFMKIEGLIVIPIFVFYYVLRAVPFSFKCRNCGRLLFDQQFLRENMCAVCTKDMATIHSTAYYKKETIAVRRVSPAQQHHDYRTVRRVKYGKIVDIGCGYGRLLSKIGNNRELYGLDISPASIKAAVVWVKHGNFCIGDARNTPYQSGSFDYLICAQVLEHIENDSVIHECFRVLKPNGKALITVPNGKGPSGRYIPYHIRLFSLQSLKTALVGAGFEIVDAYNFGLYIPLITRFLIMIALFFSVNLPFCSIPNIKVPEFLSDQFFIECNKPAQL
jgi:SAM-dependent methyltransferase